MTKAELIAKLNALPRLRDREEAHIEADALLIAFINDADIAKAYEAIEKWYA